jgi:hypothetical protein
MSIAFSIQTLLRRQGSGFYFTKHGYFWQCKLTSIFLKETPRPESASELYRPSDRRLSAKLVPTIADRECHVVSMTDPYGRNLGLLDRSRYFVFQVIPQMCSRG